MLIISCSLLNTNSKKQSICISNCSIAEETIKAIPLQVRNHQQWCHYILYCVILYYVISFQIRREPMACGTFRDAFLGNKYLPHHFTTLTLDWSESPGNERSRICIQHFRPDLTLRQLNSDHKGIEQKSSEALTLNCRLCSDKTTLKIISVWGIQNNYVNEADNFQFYFVSGECGGSLTPLNFSNIHWQKYHHMC